MLLLRIVVDLLSQWKNFELLGLPFLVFMLKFEPFLALVSGKRVEG